MKKTNRTMKQRREIIDYLEEWEMIGQEGLGEAHQASLPRTSKAAIRSTVIPRDANFLILKDEEEVPSR